MLLRVPGLGVRNVDRILRIRRWHRLTLADLTRLHVPMKKALPFIETEDHHPLRLGAGARSDAAGHGAARKAARSLRSCGGRKGARELDHHRRNIAARGMQQITFAPTFAGWQKAARQALAERSRTRGAPLAGAHCGAARAGTFYRAGEPHTRHFPRAARVSPARQNRLLSSGRAPLGAPLPRALAAHP